MCWVGVRGRVSEVARLGPSDLPSTVYRGTPDYSFSLFFYDGGEGKRSLTLTNLKLVLVSILGCAPGRSVFYLKGEGSKLRRSFLSGDGPTNEESPPEEIRGYTKKRINCYTVFILCGTCTTMSV